MPTNVIKRLAVLTVIAGIVVFLLTRHINLELLLGTGGILALGAIVFAETGLLVGFFLPGDTLLFAAGFFAAQGKISIIGSVVTVIIAAIFGNMAGYEIGRRSGPKIFKNEDALLLKPDTVENAEKFYEKHGGKTIFLARFVPVIRTLAPLIAGIGKMNYRQFMIYNITGAIVWGSAITLVGFWAGKIIGQYFNIDKYLLPIVLLAMLVTFGVSFTHVLKTPEQRKLFFKKFKAYFINFFKN